MLLPSLNMYVLPGSVLSEQQLLKSERTVGFDAFLEEGGAIDTLFLLNAAFQPGGAWVRRIFAEPLQPILH